MQLGRYLVLFFMLINTLTIVGEEKKVSLCAGEYVPFYGKDLDNNGFLAEIITEAYKSSGYSVELNFYSWGRSLDLSKNGHCDGIFSLWYNEDRCNYYLYSDSLKLPNQIGFYTKKNEYEIIDEIYQDDTARIGYVMGYIYPDVFSDFRCNYIKVYDDSELVQKLVEGKLDVVIIDKFQGDYILKNKFTHECNNFYFIEPAFEVKEQFLCISLKAKNAQEKLNDFNKGFRKIRENGDYDRILKKHGFELSDFN